MFLSDAELYILTGRRQGKRQIKVLRDLRIPHYVIDGKPVVTWDAVNGRERKKPEPFRFDRVS